MITWFVHVDFCNHKAWPWKIDWRAKKKIILYYSFLLIIYLHHSCLDKSICISVNKVSKYFLFSCVETPETGLLKNNSLIQFNCLFISDITIIILKQNILLQV